MSLQLTQLERNVLYRKYVSEGLDPIKAGERVRKIKEHLEDLIYKLRKKGKTKEEINITFKLEFAKLCEETSYTDKKRNKQRKATRKKV